MDTEASFPHCMETLEHLLEGCQIIDRDWRYRFLNQAAARHAKMPASELVGRRVTDCWPGIENTGLFARMRACMEERTVQVMENVFQYPDGSAGVFELRMTPVPEGIFILSLDVSQAREDQEKLARAEESLRQMEKLEAVGQLASGVAHDFNNIISVILGHVEMALDHFGEGVPGREDLLEIQKAARRSGELTSQLLAFARRQILEPRVVNLNDVVESVLRMLRRLIGENIELGWSPASAPGAVCIDPGQICQVLANLCVNARDAIEGQGRVSIETRAISFDEEYCEENREFKPGPYVVLEVSDDGCGMDRATMARIFEPFFTTKALGRGTGLGLSTVYGIVRQNGGFVHVYSEPENGTTFKLYFPRHEGERPEPLVPEARPVEQRGLETILLVEDEAEILRVVRASLERLGYHILASDSPRDALEKARRYPGDIQLLMTDVVLPEMTGKELADELVRERPDLRVLFSSGYTSDVIVHQGVLDAGVNFLQKPFSRRELAAKVRAVLDG